MNFLFPQWINYGNHPAKCQANFTRNPPQKQGGIPAGFPPGSLFFALSGNLCYTFG